jgi:hypothetical protein
MFESLAGKVSHLQFSSEVTGHISGSHGRVSGQMQTKQVVTFRVDGKPAQIKLKGQPSLSEGDMVVLAGKSKNGTFHARAMHNRTAGAVDHLPVIPNLVWGGVLVVLGIPLSLIIIGLPFLAIGIYGVWEGLQIKNAAAQVRSAPPMPSHQAAHS